MVAASTAAILEERMSPIKLKTRLRSVNRNQGLVAASEVVTQS